MEFGMGQGNSFECFVMDCWKEYVYYEGRRFPVGHFAAEILNYVSEVHDPLLERISTLIKYVDQVATSGENGGREMLFHVEPLLQEAVSWICTCPPFCYQDNTYALHCLSQAVDREQFDRDCHDDSEHLPYYFLSFSRDVLEILVAIYNFCILIRAFERKYLRNLKKRNESTFAKAAHECFEEDNRFFDLLEHMPFGEIQEFFSHPQLISGFAYLQDSQDKEKWITVQRIVCRRLIDFYVFDLMNGLQHGHGPSWCRNCHHYFLTTNAHVPKYCDGMAPQDSRMTCRQYGAMMHQKEQNKHHPIYSLFNTRTGTIRKHHQRRKISDELRQEALHLAAVCRDKALMDNDYAAHGYAQDMELEALYAQAQRRLERGKQS